MRHLFTFDSMQAVDPGYLVQRQMTAITEIEACSTIEGFIQKYQAQLKDEAFTIATEQHCQVFPYETESDVKASFIWLCSEHAPVAAKHTEDWKTGDVTRVELLVDRPEVKIAKGRKETLDACLTEMLRNIFRRLHAHEAPVVMRAFQVFQQATQPTQVSAQLLVQAARKEKISNDVIMTTLKERPDFWKSELLDIAVSYISAMPGDPEAKSMQIASVYQRIKALYEPEQEEQPKKSEKQPRTLRTHPKRG